MAAKAGAKDQDNSWVRFLRTYGPLPTNRNMYDEAIQKSVRRHRLRPIQLPAQFVDDIVANLKSEHPHSEILTGTAGDGKTYHCRSVWMALGGDPNEWEKDQKILYHPIGKRQLVVVKDLSELQDDVCQALLQEFATDLGQADAERIYLIAANHGQLRTRVREAASSEAGRRLLPAIDKLMREGGGVDEGLLLRLRDFTRAPVVGFIDKVIEAITGHEAWGECEKCPAANACPILENRRRLMGSEGHALFRRRLAELVEVSEHNRQHFPVRQQLALVANIILGHADAKHGLMTCQDAKLIAQSGNYEGGSPYGNVFGENLARHSGQEADVFRKLRAFGVGSETSNMIDGLLVYGADDTKVKPTFDKLIGSDDRYGGTAKFRSLQLAYVEGNDEIARAEFIEQLRKQRQRLYFVMPNDTDSGIELWDLT